MAVSPAASAREPVAAVAANMTAAATEIARLFERRTGLGVRLSFGSSGTLARQILRGAPFEVFLSADEAYAQRVESAGSQGALYAVGRLALYLPRRSPVSVPTAPAAADLSVLADPRIGRLALANPEHAPYGRAAREALEHAGLWSSFSGRLVLGENVAQAARFAATPNVDAGLLPLSLVRAEPLASAGSHALVDDSVHHRLAQRMVLLEGAGATARRFFDFVLGDEARAVLERHGYRVPR